MAAPMKKPCFRCFFCDKENASYTCPKCNISYCSLSCYRNRKHSQCSEAFYKDWVQTHLGSTDNSYERRREIVEILEKLRRKDEETEELDSDDDLDERFSRLDFDDSNLDADVIWSLLNDKEKEEFRNLVESGEAERLVPTFKPFWTFKEEVRLVVEVGSDEKLNLNKCPEVIKSIPKLESLTKAVPSKNLKYNVLNTLYAYAFVVRFYNGDHLEFPLESTEYVLHIGESLNKNVNWNNTEEAVTGAIKQVREYKEFSTEHPLALKVISDLKPIIEGPSKTNRRIYVLSALSDLSKLAEKTRKLLKSQDLEVRKQSVLDVDRHQLNLVKRKLDYYISWCNDHYDDELKVVIPELDLLHAALTIDSEIFEEQRQRVEKYPRKSLMSKPTIEEIK